MVSPTAVTVQLWTPIKMLYRGPLIVVSKKRFRRYGTSKSRMAFTTKYPNFFVFHYFLFPLADSFGGTIARKSSIIIITEPSPERLHVRAGG